MSLENKIFKLRQDVKWIRENPDGTIEWDKTLENQNEIVNIVNTFYIEQIVSAASQFGQSLVITFAAENVLLGITQEGKTGEVLNKLASVMPPLQAGSLYEAIARIRAIPPTEYDSKYITSARLLDFVNKIEAYLGLPISESL